MNSLRFQKGYTSIKPTEESYWCINRDCCVNNRKCEIMKCLDFYSKVKSKEDIKRDEIPDYLDM